MYNVRIPPGRTAITERRALYAESLAMSRVLNPRNIELPWYTSWNQHLMELLDNHNPRFLLAPQYVLWVDPNKAIEPEGQGDAQGDIEINSVYHGEVTTPSSLILPQDAVSGKSKVEGWLVPAPSQGDLDSMELISFRYTENVEQNNADADNADTGSTDTDNEDNSSHVDSYNISHTTISTAKTAPDGKSPARITDFAIIYVTPRPVEEFPLRYRGFRIDHVIVQVLVENKRYRSMDVVVQAAILFRTTKLASVIAIAASGPYWCSCLLEPVENDISNAEFNQYLKEDRELSVIRSTVNECEWSAMVRLGTRASDALFGPIHDHLARLEGRVTQ
ncbi:hypothetical protein C0995_000545 [Termitomyces sp. Mi166|nr:hypothetical protein C0995_000545 [Termitomyces sp. Mi166\